MSRYLASIILLILLVTGVGCGSSGNEGSISFATVERDGVPHAINKGENVWSDSASAPLQFELEQTFGAESGAGMLAGMRGLAVDDEGNVYVLDSRNHRLVAFGSDGTVRWAAGRQGQGPGEFENAHSLVWDGADYLYLINQNGGRVDRWSTDGTYVEGISTEQFDNPFLRLVGSASDTLVATGTAMGGKLQPVYTIDTTRWTMEEPFAIDLGLDLPEGLGVSADRALQGRTLYVGHVDRYEVSRYSLEGALQRRIVREVDYPVGPGVYSSGGGHGVMVFGTLQPLGQLSGGFELVYVSWPTNISDPDAYARRRRSGGSVEDPVYVAAFDLYDADGRLLGSLRWNDTRVPPLGGPLQLSDDDRLYTYHVEPFPQVRRYKVAVEGD